MGRKAQNNVKLLGGRPIVTGHRTEPCATIRRFLFETRRYDITGEVINLLFVSPVLFHLELRKYYYTVLEQKFSLRG